MHGQGAVVDAMANAWTRVSGFSEAVIGWIAASEGTMQ